MFPMQHSIYIWGQPCVWCCWPPLCFLAERKAPGAGWKTDVVCRALLNKLTRKKKQKNAGKGKWVRIFVLRKMHLIFSKADKIRVPKPLLSPQWCPSVLHVWCLCLDSCTIKGRDVWFTPCCVPGASWCYMMTNRPSVVMTCLKLRVLCLRSQALFEPGVSSDKGKAMTLAECSFQRMPRTPRIAGKKTRRLHIKIIQHVRV